MPARLDPGDRKILTIAAVILVVLVIATVLLSPPQAREPGYPSSYSAASGGAKATFLLLKDLGYSIERWERSPLGLPLVSGEEPQGEPRIVLILADPFMPTTSDERRAVHAFIRNGGTVIATGVDSDLVPGAKLAGRRHDSAEWKEFPAVLPSALAQGAEKIKMLPRSRWEMKEKSHLAVYGEERDPVVVTYAHGKGRIIWLAGSTPLTNAGLRESGNLAFLLNCLGSPSHTRILWDERLHGEHGSLWAFFARTPVPWALAQAGLAMLALLFTFSRRHGPVRMPTVETRLSPLEFVSTLGGLYHRAHAASSAVQVSVQRFRFLLSRRLGLPPNASISQLHEGVRDRLGWKEPLFFETLQRCDRAVRDSALPDDKALELVQALEHYTSLLKIEAPGSVSITAKGGGPNLKEKH